MNLPWLSSLLAIHMVAAAASTIEITISLLLHLSGFEILH